MYAIRSYYGLLCWLTERSGPLAPRWIALLSMLLTLGLALRLWQQSNGNLMMPVDALV